MRAKRAAFESGNNRIYELLVDNLIVSIYVLHNDLALGKSGLTAISMPLWTQQNSLTNTHVTVCLILKQSQKGYAIGISLKSICG